MGHGATIQKIHRRVDALAERRWLYVLLVFLFFLQHYASGGYAPSDSLEVILQGLKSPVIFSTPILMPDAKAIPNLKLCGHPVWSREYACMVSTYADRVVDGYLAYPAAHDLGLCRYFGTSH
jgi:hypothetical protein